MAKTKPTPDSQWDEVPGFDPARGEYVRLDTDAWLRDHGIREEARSRGERNFPPADAGDRDDIHYKIQAWVNHRGRQCQGDVSQHLSDFVACLGRAHPGGRQAGNACRGHGPSARHAGHIR